MIKPNLSKFEELKLKESGVNTEILYDFQILCLPENFNTANMGEFLEADDALKLSKLLKQRDVKCVNLYDLGIDTETAIRKANDVYLGLIWILDRIVIPIFISVLAEWLISKKRNNKSSGDNEELITKKIVHVELRLPKGEQLNYSGDVETLVQLLNGIKQDDDAV